MKITILLGITLAAFVAGALADCHGSCGDDFKGFGTEPGKCGCCPWPCCCKCVEVLSDTCTTTSTEPICLSCLDLTFMVDASGSISPFVWGITLQFVADVVNVTINELALEFPGCDIVNMAMITFGDNATLHWGLTPGSTALPNIVNVPQARRFTNIVEAMELAINDVYNQGSECVPFAVIMTDGRSNFRKLEIPSMGAAMRAAVDDNLVCIGITTNIDEEQLEQICPSGFIQLEDQFELVESIISQIVEDILDSIPPPPPPPPCPATEECFCCCSPEQYWGAGGARRGPY